MLISHNIRTPRITPRIGGDAFKTALMQRGLIGGLLLASLCGAAPLQAQSYQDQDYQAPIATNVTGATTSIDALPQTVTDTASLSALIDERIALAIERAVPQSVQESTHENIQGINSGQLYAPEAARLYLLVAAALHDSFHISKGRPGLIAQADPPHSPDSYELMEEVSRIVIGSAFDEPYPEATLLSHHIAGQILERFPKPEPTTLLLSADWTPQGAPVLPSWATAKPFSLTSAAQYRPSGPPALGSSRYQSALEAVMNAGEDINTARSAEQMETAQFWASKSGVGTSPSRWNFIALEQIGRQTLSLSDKLDTLLALNSALYDTGIATWDAKYHFQAARPDAIIAQNRASDPIAQSWLPMMDNPHHPEYVSEHSSFSAAAAHILTQKLGAQKFCTRAEDIWEQTRCYDDFETAAKEDGQSRIYGGTHFEFSHEDGLTLGKAVAQRTLEELKS